MFIQDNLQKLKEVFDSNFPKTKFFSMFIGAAIASLGLLAIGSRAPNVAGQVDFAWVLSAAGLQMLIGTGIGLMMFKSRSYLKMPPSIGPNFG